MWRLDESSGIWSLTGYYDWEIYNPNSNHNQGDLFRLFKDDWHLCRTNTLEKAKEIVRLIEEG